MCICAVHVHVLVIWLFHARSVRLPPCSCTFTAASRVGITVPVQSEHALNPTSSQGPIDDTNTNGVDEDEAVATAAGARLIRHRSGRMSKRG